jgi:hypothetical protein
MNERLRGWFKSAGIRLAAYFIATAIVVMTLTWAFPWLRNLVLTPALTPTDGIPGFDGAVLQEGPAGTFSQQVTQTAFVALLTLLGALVFTAPRVWIYTVIHRQQGYDRSFVRMLVTLPVVGAGVVQVVEGNLALAFALAGIVAAVRFRTTVKDLEDAVFAFGVIGIGLASGTGSLTMAGVISTVLCVLFYLSWRLNIGVVEARVEGMSSGGTLAEALVPGESQRAVVLGDKSAVRPLAAHDLETLTGHVERLGDFVRADALRKRKRYRELLLIYTNDPDKARKMTEAVLDEHASRWVEVDQVTLNGDEPIQVLVFLVRLKKDVRIDRMTDRLRCEDRDPIAAVELKLVSGLRKQLI